jgi:hypothetical protein
LETYCVATFHSVSQALRFEKLLLSLNLSVKLLPVPRILSSSCGIAARFPQNMLPEVEKLAQAQQADVEEVYLMQQEGKHLRAEPCPGPWAQQSSS